jgi:hypothetical protein
MESLLEKHSGLLLAAIVAIGMLTVGLVLSPKVALIWLFYSHCVAITAFQRKRQHFNQR